MLLGHVMGVSGGSAVQTQIKDKPNQALYERIGWRKAGQPALGSYLLFFVDFGSPASNRTCPAPIYGCQVLSGTLFTVQFNHTLEGCSP